MNIINKENSNNIKLLKTGEEIELVKKNVSDGIIELETLNILANANVNTLDLSVVGDNNRSKKYNESTNKQINNFLFSIVCRFSFLITISFVQIVIFFALNKNYYEYIVYVPKKRQEFWRFLTYGFIHDNHLHLWFNVIYQISLGIPLEKEQNLIKVFVVYAVGIITGALGTSHFKSNVQLIGSSAGVYSLLASHIPHVILNFGSLSYKYFRIYCFGVLFLSDIVYNILKFNPDLIISIVVHYYGAATGILIGFSIYSKSSKLTKLIFIFLTFSWTIFIYLWHS